MLYVLAFLHTNGVWSWEGLQSHDNSALTILAAMANERLRLKGQYYVVPILDIRQVTQAMAQLSVMSARPKNDDGTVLPLDFTVIV